MKKIIAMLLTVMMLALCITGCGGAKYADSAYLGTWSAATAEMSGIQLEVTDLFDNFDITLDESGKCTLSLNGEETSGKWEEIEGGFKVDGELEFIVEDGIASIDYDGVNLTFVQ